MKKFMKIFLFSLMAMCLALPLAAQQAEATQKVAIVPLIVNDANEFTEQCPMVYSEVCVKSFTYPAYDLVDTSEVRQAMSQYIEPLSKEAMEAIAKVTGADIVFGMTVDRFTVEERWNRREETMYVNHSGKMIFLNRNTGVYKTQKWQNDHELEYGFVVRDNFPIQEYTKELNRCIPSCVSKINKVKK